MKKQRDRLAERLAAYDRPRPSDDLESQIQAATDRFWRLDEDVDNANPLKLRRHSNVTTGRSCRAPSPQNDPNCGNKKTAHYTPPALPKPLTTDPQQ